MTSSKTSVKSFRIEDSLINPLYELCNSANLSPADFIKHFLIEFNDQKDSINLKGLNIAVTFKPQSEDLNPHGEYAGAFSVKVTPPQLMTQEQLDSLVFIIPEFITDHSEPYRIDSFYYQRVSTKRVHHGSSKVTRNVLSFRLVKSRWNAGVFNYSTSNIMNMVEVIEKSIKTHIENTIICYLLGYLPDSRILTTDEVEKLNAPLITSHIDAHDTYFTQID